MAYLPLDEIQSLWDENPGKTWAGLSEALEKRKTQTENGEDEMSDMLIREIDDLESSDTPYPNSVQELGEMLNERLKNELNID